MTRTTAPNWTPEEDEWLIECYPLYPNAELAAFKALDGWPRSAGSISSRARKLGLIKADGCGGRHVKRFWTDERREWFVAFVPGHSEGEISAEHERLFGTPLTEGQIGNAKCKFGVKSGTVGGRFRKGVAPANKGKRWDEYMPPDAQERCRATQYRKGHLPHNSGELLDERLAEHNVWQVKVDPRDAKNTMDYWVSRARFNWERANARPWPEGCRALHIDGDEGNDDPDNIVPVENELWPIVCGAVRGQLEWHDRETLEVAITSARITRARTAAERRARIAAGRPRADDIEKEMKWNER